MRDEEGHDGIIPAAVWEEKHATKEQEKLWMARVDELMGSLDATQRRDVAAAIKDMMSDMIDRNILNVTDSMLTALLYKVVQDENAYRMLLRNRDSLPELIESYCPQQTIIDAAKADFVKSMPPSKKIAAPIKKNGNNIPVSAPVRGYEEPAAISYQQGLKRKKDIEERTQALVSILGPFHMEKLHDAAFAHIHNQLHIAQPSEAMITRLIEHVIADLASNNDAYQRNVVHAATAANTLILAIGESSMDVYLKKTSGGHGNPNGRGA